MRKFKAVQVFGSKCRECEDHSAIISATGYGYCLNHYRSSMGLYQCLLCSSPDVTNLKVYSCVYVCGYHYYLNKEVLDEKRKV